MACHGSVQVAAREADYRLAPSHHLRSLKHNCGSPFESCATTDDAHTSGRCVLNVDEALS